MPLCTCTRPGLLKEMPIVLVPVPAVLRRAPALAKRAVPELSAKARPSAARSKVALDVLVNRPALQVTWPAVQVPALLFRIVPPFHVFDPPVIARLPLA